MFLGSDISDYKVIESVIPSAFSYIRLPGGPRTLLNYISSFGVYGNSYNTNSSGNGEIHFREILNTRKVLLRI